jgi:hypothetical protein
MLSTPRLEEFCRGWLPVGRDRAIHTGSRPGSGQWWAPRDSASGSRGPTRMTMADTRLRRSVTPTRLFDAKTGPVLPSVTMGCSTVAPGSQRVTLATAASGVGSYQEQSMSGKNFTTVSASVSILAPR